MLFEDAYSGHQLTVSAQTHIIIADLFPEVDRWSEYREADAWLLNCAPSRRPRNVRRFLMNWMKRSKRRDAGALYVYEQGVKCKVTQADIRTGRVNL